MLFKSLLSILLITLSLQYSHGAALSRAQLSDIENTVEELINNSHKVLKEKKVNIFIHTIDSPTYFFESNFTITRFLFGAKKYRVGVNPAVFEKSIPYDALVGVLAHELCHTEDYATGSTLGKIIPIGIRMLTKKSRAKYERQTDLKLIEKGHAMNMKAYRLWQYPLLSKEDLKRKRKEYLTPEEFDYVDSIRIEHPEILKSWIKNPPNNLGGFKKSFEAISVFEQS